MPKAKAETTKEEVKEPTNIEKCQAMHDKGMGEDEIIGALAKFDGMSIMKAVGVFKKFQKVAGLILSKEDRVTAIETGIAEHVSTVTEEDEDGDDVEVSKIDVSAASEALITTLNISPGAAKGHIRRYCKANDIEMPSRAQMAVAALEEFKDTVVKGIKAGKTKAAVCQELFDNFESVDEKQAKRIYTRIAKAEGLASARGQDHAAVIAFLKEHGAEYATKDGLANALVAELEMTMSAAKRVWNFYSFVKQYNAEAEEAEAA